ncbi:MAG TPA: protein phosphatase 2C domain-containing protein [Anaerovoracaceae bacterium]|nr:protein phosphatase 2C domain-containing protein [Anaerovoracaceae bacterium]
MNSDSAFYIGKTHHVCQDYAAHGSFLKEPFAIVSDGCSSSPDTDFGSRFLTKVCLDYFSSLHKVVEVNNLKQIISEADYYSRNLGLPAEALDATLLFAKVKDQNYQIVCAGDGVIAKLKRDGAIEITQIEYDSGAPYYLNYQLLEKRNEGYKEKFGLLRRIKTYSIVKGIPTSIITKEDDDGNIFLEEGPAADYVALAVMSDGILSFMETVRTATSKTNVPVEPYKVLTELLSFKSYTGVFVQRRFQRFRKDCEERGWFSMDDISIGAVHLGE